MELEELKIIWEKQEEKINRNWQINLELLRITNLDRAKSKMNSLTWITALTLAFNLLLSIFFITFLVKNLNTIQFAVSGFVLTIWSLLIAFGSMKQLSIIEKIDYSEPIPLLQRKLENLKLIILTYIKLAQWILPFYLVFVVFWFKVLFDFDIIQHAGKTWFIIQIILSIALIPLSIWIHKKLQPKNINKKWVNSIMKGAGSQISEALNFIDQIERFEKRE